MLPVLIANSPVSEGQDVFLESGQTTRTKGSGSKKPPSIGKSVVDVLDQCGIRQQGGEAVNALRSCEQEVLEMDCAGPFKGVLTQLDAVVKELQKSTGEKMLAAKGSSGIEYEAAKRGLHPLIKKDGPETLVVELVDLLVLDPPWNLYPNEAWDACDGKFDELLLNFCTYAR